MYLSVSDIKQLKGYQARPKPADALVQAAVAIIVRDTEAGSEFLMMQRAKSERDPWSGQMAFPGGKIDPGDNGARAAAMREAYEEVGIELHDDDYIGQLDDLYGLKVDGVFSVHVSCFIFKPQAEIKPIANYEVADLVWLPLAFLHDPDNAHDYNHPANKAFSMPAVMINADKDQILWGLSLRMLVMLHEILQRPMSVLSQARHNELRQLEKREMKKSELDSVTQKIIARNS